MADEMKDETLVAPEVETPAETATNGKKKRDETPIEELFDLTKPIPRVRVHLSTVHGFKIYEYL
jgi:hypothetical protein